MRTKTVPMALFDRRLWLAFSLVLAVFLCAATLPAFAAEHGADAAAVVPAADAASTTPWWVWPLSLFVVSFSLGVVAVLGGVGGGVLYVPIVSGFFPFHLDFVRGAGLLVALAGALAAGPGLLKKGMADLRLSIPVALIASSSAIVGAMVGLALPGERHPDRARRDDPRHRRHHVPGEEVRVPQRAEGRRPLDRAADQRHLPRGHDRTEHRLEDPPHAPGPGRPSS